MLRLEAPRLQDAAQGRRTLHTDQKDAVVRVRDADGIEVADAGEQLLGADRAATAMNDQFAGWAVPAIAPGPGGDGDRGPSHIVEELPAEVVLDDDAGPVPLDETGDLDRPDVLGNPWEC